MIRRTSVLRIISMKKPIDRSDERILILLRGSSLQNSASPKVLPTYSRETDSPDLTRILELLRDKAHDADLQRRRSLRLMFVGCQPRNKDALSTGHELSEIKATLNECDRPLSIEIEELYDSNFDRLRPKMIAFNPHIFHFSGHGIDGTQICLTDPSHNFRAQNIHYSKMIPLLNSISNLKLALFNACSTDILAKNIARRSKIHTIGMRGPHSSKAAIEFSKVFYINLKCEHPLAESYRAAKDACEIIETEIGSDPRIYRKPGLDPKSVIL